MSSAKVMRIDGRDEEENNYPGQKLPDEIIVYILSYLPHSSLFKFKCVCKLWNTLFLHPHFSLLHEQHSMSSSLDWEEMQSDGDSFYTKISQSSHGLLLEQTANSTNDASTPLRYRISCPILCQMLAIPNPQYPTLCIALEYVPSKAAVKLVSVHEDDDEHHSLGYEILVVGIGSDHTTYCWRAVTVPPGNLQQNMSGRKRNRIEVFFRLGVAYCISYVETPSLQDDDLDIEIDVLDMVNESYIGHTTFPRGRGFFSKLSSTNLLDWNGRLSFAQLVKDELHVLLLDDYRKLKWAETKRIIKLTFLKPNNKELMTFYTRADTMLFFVRQDRKSFCSYDINTGRLITTPMLHEINSGEYVAKLAALIMFCKGAN